MKNNRHANSLVRFCKEHGVKVSKSTLHSTYNDYDFSSLVALRVYEADGEVIAVEMQSSQEVISEFWPSKSTYYIINRKDYENLR